MKKPLSILVILLWSVFPVSIHAEALLLIDHLKQEGMLIPESGALFNSTSDASENTSPPSPLIFSGAPSASAPAGQNVTPAPHSDVEPSSNKEVVKLKRQLSKVRKELQTITYQYRALAAAQPRPATELAASFREENKQLQQQLMAAEKQITEITRRYEKQEKQYVTQIETLKANVASHAPVAAQAAGDKSAFQELRAALAARDAEIAQLTATLSAAKKQGSERDKTLAQINTEHSQSAKRLATLEADLKTTAEALEKAKEPAFSLKKNPSEEMRVNYASGVYYAARARYEMKAIEQAGVTFSAKALQQGIKDKLNGTLQLSEGEIGKILANIDRKVAEVHGRESESNRQKSEQFVAQAAKRKGAEQAINGVVYQVVKKGTLPLLSPDDVIRFRLNERISTGKMISKGEIRAGQVGRLPDLMQQGVRRLGVGGKIKITVPWQLAYGEQGIPGTVPPGVASELTIEVTGINK